MEIDKINNNRLISEIVKIYNIDNEFIKLKEYIFFDIIFEYKDIIIHLYTNIDDMQRTYQSIEIKPISNDNKYEWTSFYLLFAYNENKQCVMKIDYQNLVTHIKLLKKYIDENKIFFEFYNKDYSKRYFIIEGKTKQMPKLIDLKNETYLRFEDNAYKIDNNKPLF